MLHIWVKGEVVLHLLIFQYLAMLPLAILHLYNKRIWLKHWNDFSLFLFLLNRILSCLDTCSRTLHLRPSTGLQDSTPSSFLFTILLCPVALCTAPKLCPTRGSTPQRQILISRRLSTLEQCLTHPAREFR